MAIVEIDGKRLEADAGKMIIEVADDAGISIPRFCYHKKLSIAANCRMCLVEVEGGRKTVPACATPISDGMKVKTSSEAALHSQKAVMEFLLINHPLDCPICDQGGECELQDVAMGYGSDVSRFTEGKRVVDDEDIGPLIATDMTRCIHCTRCVRFGEEVAGFRELGATDRGEHMRIGTYIKHGMASEVSGNIIDLCPVGALTSKPYRFTARAWEMQQRQGVSPHDCLGSNLHVHTRRQEVMRVVPKENEAINEEWLSDRDRFSYLGLTHTDRVAKPLLKRHGEWKEVSWEQALTQAAQGIKHILQQYGAKQVAALASPNSTVEEFYLLQKMMRYLGVANIDHRLREVDVADQHYASRFPGGTMPYAELQNQQAILLVGSHVHHECPLAGVRIRKAFLQGAKVMAINPVALPSRFTLEEQVLAPQADIPRELAKVAKALSQLVDEALPKGADSLLADIEPDETARAIAKHLHAVDNAVIVLGLIAAHHQQAATLRSLAKLITRLSRVNLLVMSDGANSAGGWLAGAVPHRGAGGQMADQQGLPAHLALQQELKAYFLLGAEPEFDCVNPRQARKSLSNAELVVALTPYTTQAMKQYADIILPIVPVYESSGTFVNIDGQWQSFRAAVKPFGEARPAWKVLRVLANLFKLQGFDYLNTQDVLAEAKQVAASVSFIEPSWYSPPALTPKNDVIYRLGEWPVYRVDPLVRRAQALQACGSAEKVTLRINSKLAARLGFAHGDDVVALQHESYLRLPLVIDESIADNTIYLPSGYAETSSLADASGAINLVDKDKV